MIIYPAMDLMGGRIARLSQGRFDQKTLYPVDPLEALADFAAAGANWAHVVDLDGARAGYPVQHDLLADLAAASSLRLQVAGGFRSSDQLTRMFDSGVCRIVIGSLAVKQPDRVRAWLDQFGKERIGIALDVRMTSGEALVATSGWAENSRKSLWEISALYPRVRHILLTDIGRDGMLEGPNFALLEEAARRLPECEIQASGGVTTLSDLARLGTAGAIIGKALWEGRLNLSDAVRACS